MRYLILSDVHGNWEALQAVLAAAENRYDQILCCGDLVGYGADPNPITAWAQAQVPVVVRGNHDKACTGLEDLEWFNPAARASALWTMSVLTPEHADYLRTLPAGPLGVAGFQVLHGSPVDEDEYLITPADAAQVASYLEVKISFFGHTHLQGGFFLHRNGTRRIQPHVLDGEGDALELENDVNYLLNPGSVGQPRDGDPRAAYLIYALEQRLITYHRVEYDIGAAQRKIVDAGLPDVLARRLEYGQ